MESPSQGTFYYFHLISTIIARIMKYTGNCILAPQNHPTHFHAETYVCRVWAIIRAVVLEECVRTGQLQYWQVRHLLILPADDAV